MEFENQAAKKLQTYRGLTPYEVFKAKMNIE
ncbi:unnamed protein product, partial [marine sediment metagenome]